MRSSDIVKLRNNGLNVKATKYGAFSKAEFSAEALTILNYAYSAEDLFTKYIDSNEVRRTHHE